MQFQTSVAQALRITLEQWSMIMLLQELPKNVKLNVQPHQAASFGILEEKFVGYVLIVVMEKLQTLALRMEQKTVDLVRNYDAQAQAICNGSCKDFEHLCGEILQCDCVNGCTNFDVSEYRPATCK